MGTVLYCARLIDCDAAVAAESSYLPLCSVVHSLISKQSLVPSRATVTSQIIDPHRASAADTALTFLDNNHCSTTSNSFSDACLRQIINYSLCQCVQPYVKRQNIRCDNIAKASPKENAASLNCLLNFCLALDL